MKKKSISLFLVLMFFIPLLGGAQLVTNVAFPNSIGKNEKFEIHLDLPSHYSQSLNPYKIDDVEINCVFTSPTGVIYEVSGFYYEGVSQTISPNTINPSIPFDIEKLSYTGQNNWRIRFTPNETGQWDFEMTVTSQTLNESESYPRQPFTCMDSELTGFIRKANDRYLKFEDGERYYPIGTNIPWMERFNWRGKDEAGTIQFKEYIDQMVESGLDMFRLEINYFEGISIFGYDYRDSKNYYLYYNQKDSWQLDEILDYAKLKEVNVFIALFAHVTMGDLDYCNGNWEQFNPYNKNNTNPPVYPDQNGGLESPYDFFSDSDAINSEKQLLRYIISRYGYATNIMAFELMDEADNLQVFNDPLIYPIPSNYNSDLISWHNDMYDYIKDQDPHDHLITTAFAGSSVQDVYSYFNKMDFTTTHFYQNTVNLTNTPPNFSGQYEDALYNKTDEYLTAFKKPHITEEWKYYEGFSLVENDDFHLYKLHENAWSTMLNGSMGSGMLWIFNTPHLTFGNYNFVNSYKGLKSFTSQFKNLHDQCVPKKVYNESYRSHYLYDKAKDRIYGWAQINSHIFSSIWYSVNKPFLNNFNSAFKPSVNNIVLSIPIEYEGLYEVNFYSTVNGAHLGSYDINCTGNQSNNFAIQSSMLNNKYGDVAYTIEFKCDAFWRTRALNPNDAGSVRSNSPITVYENQDNKHVAYIGTDNRVHEMWYDEENLIWVEVTLNMSVPANVRYDSDLEMDFSGKVCFIANDNRVHQMWWNGSNWVEATLDPNSPPNVAPGSRLTSDSMGKIYFTGLDHRIHQYWWNGSNYVEATLNTNAPANAQYGGGIAVDFMGKVNFVAMDNRVHQYWWNGTNYVEATLNANAPQNVSNNSSLVCDIQGKVNFVATDNRVHQYWWNGTNYVETALNVNANATVKNGTDLSTDDFGNIYFIATDNRVHEYYWGGSNYVEAVLNVNAPTNAGFHLDSDLEGNVFYNSINSPSRVFVSHWGCKEQFKTDESGNNTEKETELLSKISIIPNPTNGDIRLLDLDVDKNYDLYVYDLTGKLLVVKSNVVGQSKIRINLLSGVYVVYLKSENTLVNITKLVIN